jgi:D-alanyl-D-alanine carboxypeptidase/D-alanyl-D-alanine-endopeptidase (penicillin-binding protein 4)
MKQKALLSVAVGISGVALVATSCSTESQASRQVPQAATAIMNSDPYKSANWSYLVRPAGDSEATYSAEPDVIVPMGSNAKLYTVGTWVESAGSDTRITTPVHKVADTLALVANGDLVMGGRNAASGTLGYSIPPQPDANGLPGAKPAPGDPLAGLNDLAKQVAKSGVKQIKDVEIDVRLFDEWDAHDEVISPIVINDNLIAIQTTPTTVGQPAKLTVVPDTKAFKIQNAVTTVATGADSDVQIVATADDRTLRVEGTVAAGADTLLNVFNIPDPATFARTLFIEALERESVQVQANAYVKNNTKALPATYPTDSEVASITSPTVKAIATLIWKISHNYGANLTACLLAVKAGSKDCEVGLKTIHDQAESIGIDPTSFWLLDGSGEGFSSTTPAAIVTWIDWLRSRSWGGELSTMLPILGVDGSLQLFQKDTAATGKVQAKTGTYAGLEPGVGRLLVPGQTLAGLMQGADGKEYVFGLYSSGGSFPDPSTGILKSANIVADVAAALQESLSNGQ